MSHVAGGIQKTSDFGYGARGFSLLNSGNFAGVGPNTFVANHESEEYNLRCEPGTFTELEGGSVLVQSFKYCVDMLDMLGPRVRENEDVIQQACCIVAVRPDDTS